MAQQSLRFATPSSSHIESVDWDGETDTMAVTFRDGRTYDHLNVPSSVVRQFMAAPSAGAFFARHIKGRYVAEEQ